MSVNYKTTTELVNAALDLKMEAKNVKNAEEHAAWWDRKVDVYRAINEALESGGFVGEAYDELHYAKHLLATAEAYAGEYARN